MHYFSGFDIFAGNHVKPSMPTGDVVIDTDGDVILDGRGAITLDKGFEVKLGGQLEIR